jgi:hypothetical protein
MAHGREGTVMPSDHEVERVAAIIIAAMLDDYGAPLVSSVMARHAARAVLSAIPSYAQGWKEAVEEACAKVEELWWSLRDSRGFDHLTVQEAIRAIEQEKGTHEERWAAAGWPFAWDDDVRAYVCPVGEITGLPSLPTVQAVDAWIAAHGKGE